MSPWAVSASAYGMVLAGAALAMPIRRRLVAVTACLAYALIAYGAGTLGVSLVAQLLVPAALLLVGYWLSGFFFRDPQHWLETWLMASDRRLFRAADVDGWLRRAPMWVLELLEAVYTSDYVVVAAGVLVAAATGSEAVTRYWNVVLTAELACYVALPWLRSRPPRVLEPGGVMSARAPRLRRLNTLILDRASVQANTLPSGHVAGALAAALAVTRLDPIAGAILLSMAALIAVAAIAGRYHYVVDCVAAVVVAATVSLLL